MKNNHTVLPTNGGEKKIPNTGEKREKLFNKLGIFSLLDLLEFYPRSYEDRTVFYKISEIMPGESCCFRATVGKYVTSSVVRSGLEITKTRVFDETGEIGLVFFNSPYVRNTLIYGKEYIFYGKKDDNQITNPVFEETEKSGKLTGCILPIYRTTKNLAQGYIRTAVKTAIEETDKKEIFSPEFREKYNLCDIDFAVKNIHFPKDLEAMETARRRLVFEELYLLQVALRERKELLSQATGLKFQNYDIQNFLQQLPFELTDGQKSAIQDIIFDIKKGKQMNRLLQGDVGSGKTAVAMAAIYLAAKNGYQSALMVPTEILAEQHYGEFSVFFNDLRVELLTGHITRQREIRARIKNGECDCVVGTHALISDTVEFANLGMVITDEQHRFGVNQREKFQQKGKNPHRLVMSATPIPQTLARIIYGDLDISLIKNMPTGRLPVETFLVNESYRDRIDNFIQKNVSENGQVYVVCPLIEDGETGISAEQQAKYLREKFPELRVGLMHGKLKPTDREKIMREFALGETQILVSTTVIEVGVNVPRATLMIIENAERFGLSQLHQLRGRVGRGNVQSYCVMFMQSGGQVSKERLHTMTKTNDGFEIAEQDLKLRGPGDFFGDRQHGLPEFKLADLNADMNLLELTREASNMV